MEAFSWSLRSFGHSVSQSVSLAGVMLFFFSMIVSADIAIVVKVAGFAPAAERVISCYRVKMVSSSGPHFQISGDSATRHTKKHD